MPLPPYISTGTTIPPYTYPGPVNSNNNFSPYTILTGYTHGVTYSNYITGGFHQVYNVSDLYLTGVTNNAYPLIPILILGYSGTVVPNVTQLFLNNDNMSSGRRKVGMLSYVYETNTTYQLSIDNYNILWTAATASTSGIERCVVFDYNEFTLVKSNTPEGIAFINAWTNSLVEGVSGTTRPNAAWRIFTTSGGTSGGTGTSGLSGISGISGTGGSGLSGISGLSGLSGRAGSSSNCFEYLAKTTITSGNPGDGYILWDSATQTGSTMITVDHIDDTGIDIDIFLSLLSVGQTITIQDQTFSGNYQIWSVTGTPIQYISDYWEIPVTLISSSGTGSSNFANDLPILLCITSSGGDSGLSGISGQNGISTGQIYYFNESVTQTPLTYKELSPTPLATAQQVVTKTITGSTNDVLISEFITDELGFAVIPGGTQRFHHHFLKPASNDGLEYYCQIDLANSAGTSYNTFTANTNTALIGWVDNVTPVESLTDLVLPTTTINSTDRMIVRIYANNIDATNHILNWYTEGTSYYSFAVTSVGVIGNSGLSGLSGIVGISGISGLQGISGISGIVGTSGLSGLEGSSGIVGNSGLSGISGIQGTSGLSGISGIVGTSGLSGISGIVGTSGLSGISGIVGTSGLSGISGLVGVSGLSGIVGTSGLSGIVGTSGLSGISGLVGTSGLSGIVGTSGISGIVGTSGLSGISGLVGTSGLSGLVGVSGLSGISGIVGTSGLSGISGLVGTSGLSGLVGESGLSGLVGNSGISGISGLVGNSGISGLEGLSGISGLVGNSGISGIVGTSGISGLEGQSGISGIVGSSGISGLVGVSGISGLEGVSGISGIVGTSGISGISGKPGQSSSCFPYTANTTSNSGNPGIAGILWNNVTQTGSTQINIHHIDEDNIDIDIFLNLLSAGQNFIIQNRTVSNDFQTWTITGTPIQISSIYWELPVSLVNSSGNASTGFTNGDEVIFCIVSSQSGLSGISGLVGSSGLSGLSGIVGTSGISGIVGTSGMSGLVGSSGISGLVGNSGTSGLVGSSGLSGLVGNSGISGISGLVGSSGISGIVGTSGLSGLVGESGISGIVGTSGLSGLVGASGISGLQGTSGISGLEGLSGISGLVGSSGLSGLVGNSGISGLVGVSGISGLQGLSGISGLLGNSGISGIEGVSGISGISGLIGVSGISGISGIEGPFCASFSAVSDSDGSELTYRDCCRVIQNITLNQGETFEFCSPSDTDPAFTTGSGTVVALNCLCRGESGISGLQGLSGLSGLSGKGGESGLSGISGIAGSSGISGIAGSSGISGLVGVSGISGLQGVSGISGLQGTSGISGLVGTSGLSGISGIEGVGVSGISGLQGGGGASRAYLTADLTISSTASLNNITGLAISVVANTYYKFMVELLVDRGNAATPNRYGMTFPNMTEARGMVQATTSIGNGGLAVSLKNIQQRWDGNSASGSVLLSQASLANLAIWANYQGIFYPATNGTIQMQIGASTGAGQVIILRGSYIEVLSIGT